ncbi:insulinase family protein [Mucilaginibacter sp. R11]|uniref:Insulinase family protein n=2 Tax=Mucilaginibacter agri TaxID=2695265 RepID=A0A965ZFG4_9SPHI|nr:insulinase family protein [Mucilaginibacter agri]
MLDRTLAPHFGAIEHIKLVEPKHIKLPNGSNLYYFNSGEQDLVRIEWVFGNVRFNADRPLLNSAVITMLTEGTSTLTASQIADKIDYYGAFLQAEYGYDNSVVTLYSLSKHLASTLPVIKDIITDSVFPESELQTYIRNQQQKLQVSLQKNDVVARRTFNKAIYGESLYGFAGDGADYQQLQRADMLAHFKQMYQPSNCDIFLAGKIDDEVLNLVTDAFGASWANGPESADISQPAVKSSNELFYFIEKPEALQSAIRIGTRSINRSHPDFPALQVLNTILGGYFGSRLMANIREDKGYTYGIGSGMSALKHGGALFIATEVGADVCRDALSEIEKEINRLKTELVPQEELDLVRNYMLGSLLGSLENVFSHADKFKNVYFSDLDYAYYDRYTNVVKAITPQDVLDLANKYLDFDKMYKVIVGKY